MEFGEKLQQLRKSKGLTQEELAQALYVSRTAVSKWESGRGYPSIDSLKEISAYFSVTMDDLLSGEKLLSLAEKENKANIQAICRLLLGITDLLSVLLVILPLYPKAVNGYVYSVNLPAYTEKAALYRTVYWCLFLSLIITGIWRLWCTCFKAAKHHKIITGVSMALSISAVVILALTGETYAVTVVFLLLLIKMFLLFRHNAAH